MIRKFLLSFVAFYMMNFIEALLIRNFDDFYYFFVVLCFHLYSQCNALTIGESSWDWLPGLLILTLADGRFSLCDVLLWLLGVRGCIFGFACSLGNPKSATTVHSAKVAITRGAVGSPL